MNVVTSTIHELYNLSKLIQQNVRNTSGRDIYTPSSRWHYRV